MASVRTLIACLMILGLPAVPLAAQEATDSSVEPQSLDALIESIPEQAPAVAVVIPPVNNKPTAKTPDELIDGLPQQSGVVPATMSSRGRAAYDDALERQYRHHIWSLEHRETIFVWQHWAGVIVFFIANGVVIAGLAMSWLQFQAGLRPSETTLPPKEGHSEADGKPADAADGEIKSPSAEQATSDEMAAPPNHSLTVTPTSATVSTSFVGVVILTLSLAFFYLYLQFVFPISN